MTADLQAQDTQHNKLRWQSRRGLLELDLLLDKFWQQSPTLSEEDMQGLAELLALEDEDLWQLIRSGCDSLDDDSLASTDSQNIQNSKYNLSPAGQKIINILRRA